MRIIINNYIDTEFFYANSTADLEIGLFVNLLSVCRKFNSFPISFSLQMRCETIVCSWKVAAFKCHTQDGWGCPQYRVRSPRYHQLLQFIESWQAGKGWVALERAQVCNSPKPNPGLLWEQGWAEPEQDPPEKTGNIGIFLPHH